jgi:tetratricopeptide (TPR) repeat protein
LSVFQGGCTLETIEAVCNVDDDLSTASVNILDVVQSLVDKSLLRREEGADVTRFVMLETIHEYATEKLEESGEAGELRRRHALYFMKLAEEAEPNLVGGKQQEWLNILGGAHDNLRGALQWARAEADTPSGAHAAPEPLEVGLRIGGAIWRFWYVRGYFSEGRQELAAIMSKVPSPKSRVQSLESAAETRDFGLGTLDPYRAKVLNGAAVLANLQGDYEAARAFDYEGLAIVRELGDKQAMPPFLDDLGIMARQQGDYAAARSFYEESLAIRREIGDRRGIAISLDNLGIVFREQGNDTAARSHYEESLAIRREIGDKHGIAFGLSNLGNAMQAQGDYASARSALEESLALRREIADKRGIAISLNNLGTVAMLQGDYEVARASLEEGLALVRELGDRQGIAYLLNSRGNLARQQGDYPTARSLYEECLAIRRDIGDRRGVAATLIGLAAVTSGTAGTAGTVGTVGMEGKESESARQVEAERVEISVRLLAAANALLEAMGAVPEASDRLPYEQSVALARSRLGEERFSKAWDAGRTMSWEQAVEYALQDNAS